MERRADLRRQLQTALESHQEEVDPQRVLLYARENLDDMEAFLIQVGQWLGQELYPTQEPAG